MKKLYKILLLTLIITLTVCVRSYASVDDASQNSGSSTEVGTTEGTDTSVDSSAGSTDTTVPGNTEDSSTTPGSTEEDTTTTPGGTEEDTSTPGSTGEDSSTTTPDSDKEDTTTPDGTGDDSSTTDGNDKTDTEGVYTTQDTNTSIKLSATTGVVPDGTTLDVEAITSGTVFDAISEKLGDVKFSIFDISLISNNVAVQPSNGTVKISIPIPSGYNTSNLVVYRFANDGTQEQEYAVTVDGNYAVFETNHFSNYVLAEKTATSTSTDNSQLDSEPKTGIANPITVIVSTLAIACLGLFVCIKKLSK